MNDNGEQTKNKILGIIKKHPEGLTIESLSRITGSHRQTVTKYLFWLYGENVLYRRKVGPATLYYMKEFVKNFGKE